MQKDYSMSDPEHFRWVKATGQAWKLNFPIYVALWGYFAIPATLLCFVLLPWHRGALRAIPVIWTIYIVAYLAGVWVEYSIRCPRCRFNPLRTKKDGRLIAPKLLNWRLCGLEVCPKCGFAGDAAEKREAEAEASRNGVETNEQRDV